MAAGGESNVGPRNRCAPDHMVPITLFLAAQDASGVTGKMFDVMEWNMEHGLGGADAWRDTSFSYEALRAQL